MYMQMHLQMHIHMHIQSKHSSPKGELLCCFKKMEIESDYFSKVKVPGAKILDIKHNIFNVMAQENNYFFKYLYK